MPRALRSWMVAVVTTVSCVDSDAGDRERTVRAEAALASESFAIACEPTPVNADVAFRNGTGLAVWATKPGSYSVPNAVHAARFDAQGAVLDAPAIELGTRSPYNLEPVGQWSIEALRVVPVGPDGFAVVTESRSTHLWNYLSLDYRIVGSDGLAGPWFHLMHASADGGCWLRIREVASNSSSSWVAAEAWQTSLLGGDDLPTWISVFSIEGSAPTLAVETHGVDCGGCANPRFGGLGCSENGCFFADTEVALAPGGGIDTTHRGRILGGGTVTFPSPVEGTIVGTFTNYLVIDSGATSVRTFDSELTEVVPASPLWGIPLDPPAVATYEGDAARVIWPGFGGVLQSGRLGDDGVVHPGVENDGPAVGHPRAAAVGLASSVVVWSEAGRVMGRFIGAEVAQVSTATCPPPSDPGGGGAGAAGGAASTLGGGGAGGLDQGGAGGTAQGGFGLGGAGTGGAGFGASDLGGAGQGAFGVGGFGVGGSPSAGGGGSGSGGVQSGTGGDALNESPLGGGGGHPPNGDVDNQDVSRGEESIRGGCQLARSNPAEEGTAILWIGTAGLLLRRRRVGAADDGARFRRA